MLKNIKKLREELGISQQTLGDAVGVSQQSINKYENHSVEPDIDTLKKLADYFKTSIDYLVENTDIRSKAQVTKEYELNEAEQKIINSFRKLSSKRQQTVLKIIDELINAFPN